MSEAESKSAELVDIEPDDFVRFLEYAYCGDYTIPLWTLDEGTHVASDVEESPTMEEDPSSQPPDAELVDNPMEVPEPEPEPVAVPEEDLTGWARLPTRKKLSPRQKRKMEFRSSFQQRSYLTGVMPHHTILEGYKPKANTAANQDFTPVFLAHAHLYSFADMRLIQPLKDLALYKLHRTLLEFQLYHQRVGDVVELARYAYDHGPSRSDSGVLDGLRQLVVEYMACEVDIIGKHLEFHILLEAGGEFVSDFWRIVARYML
ncbi:hypothetical protein FB567DRAFT_136836 [Paraphoma chrysanthemicola]|uniref:BTB domain-containing protein n=1 Tax=Paraphoma chrysanthemicola TaxID=798071 RepID=A0A8K0R0Z4_9PLEO|nr:hypothetical protein FB567DRAFT_136836 [Paraphoma chrysanthemicola]